VFTGFLVILIAGLPILPEQRLLFIDPSYRVERLYPLLLQ
jgi:hypothetical protein